MSRFYSTVSNRKSTQTKCGHATDGLSAHIRGWNIGVQVDIIENEEGKDEIRIFKTSGSNNNGNRELITILK